MDDLTCASENELSERVFAAIAAEFPVSESPYCDLGEALGASESDVLEATLQLRECGRVARLCAEFADLGGFAQSADPDDADLAGLVSFDLPTSEHPYDEVALQLQMRGVDRNADWVIARLRSWLADGTVTRIAAFAE